MPLHRIYTSQGLYTPLEKSALAKAITDFYGTVLPRFYVLVVFIDIPEDSFFVGGERNNKFVRFNVQHLARHFEKSRKISFMKRYEETISPFTSKKGLDWEMNVDEADQVTWHENGMSPPAPNSYAEKVWKDGNKAVMFEGPSFKDTVVLKDE